jgi:hypothetical protein
MATDDQNWEARFAAMEGLGEASLKMRSPGKWYVHQPEVAIKAQGRDGSPADGPSNDAPNPIEAVQTRWRLLTSSAVEYKRGRLVRRVRWNGFMWADVQTDGDAAAT